MFAGAIGSVGREGAQFSAELASVKQQLLRDVVPRTSPSCRAEFCGEGCTLSGARYTREGVLSEIGGERQWVKMAGATPDDFAFGWLRPIDGADAGVMLRIRAVEGDWLVLERPLAPGSHAGLRALMREGCDHTVSTCAQRFGNAVNFQGEPYLPGNDLLTRYPVAQG